MRLYGLDLWADLGTPRLSFRRLWVLLERMPWDSEYVRERFGEQAQWGPVEHLLATIADLLQAGNHQFASVNAKKGSKPKRPEPIERPGAVKRRVRYRSQLSDNEIARRLVDQQRRTRRG